MSSSTPRVICDPTDLTGPTVVVLDEDTGYDARSDFTPAGLGLGLFPPFRPGEHGDDILGSKIGALLFDLIGDLRDELHESYWHFNVPGTCPSQFENFKKRQWMHRIARRMRDRLPPEIAVATLWIGPETVDERVSLKRLNES